VFTRGVSIGETPSVIVGDRTLPLHPDEKGHSTLHLWIDGSIIELFVDGRQVITVRFYAVNHGASEIHAKWTGSPESLVSMIVSDIIPVSSDRKTT
jgi:beta-fructofuranosidase